MKTVKLGETPKKVQTGITLVNIARKEKNNQKWIELAQLSIQKGELTLAKGIEAAKKELERVAKIRAELKKFKINPKGDYTMLKSMFETTLKALTLDSLTLDYSNEATKRATKFHALNEEQREIVAQFYNLKARKEYAIISQVRAFLELVGEIKPEKIEVAKKEAVKELAD